MQFSTSFCLFPIECCVTTPPAAVTCSSKLSNREFSSPNLEALFLPAASRLSLGKLIFSINISFLMSASSLRIATQAVCHFLLMLNEFSYDTHLPCCAIGHLLAQPYIYICGNKMPTRCNRGFYCRSYCLLNMFRASPWPSSGAQEYYTVVAACSILCCGFSSSWSGVALRVMRTHNPQLHTRPAT